MARLGFFLAGRAHASRCRGSGGQQAAGGIAAWYRHSVGCCCGTYIYIYICYTPTIYIYICVCVCLCIAYIIYIYIYSSLFSQNYLVIPDVPCMPCVVDARCGEPQVESQEGLQCVERSHGSPCSGRNLQPPRALDKQLKRAELRYSTALFMLVGAYMFLLAIPRKENFA